MAKINPAFVDAVALQMFCELYVLGGVAYAGQHTKCYRAAFNIPEKDPDIKGFYAIQSKLLLSQPHVSQCIKELFEENINEDETVAVKLQVADTLRAIMAEASTLVCKDKYGQKVSPAPLRAVAVNASRALAEIFPIKHVEETKIKIEGGGGITFNVVVPSAKQKEESQE